MDKDTRQKGSLSCLSEQNLSGNTFYFHWYFIPYFLSLPGECLCVQYQLQFSSSGAFLFFGAQSYPNREGCPGVSQDSLKVSWLPHPVLRPPPMLGPSLLSAQLMQL